VTVLVDLPAVRPARLAERLAGADLSAHVRELRATLRGALVRSLDDGVRLAFELPLDDIARLAEQVRAEADALPFFAFRLLADPPSCVLEVRGGGRAGAIARALFAEIARPG
jgi:hypothetical protein